MVLLRKIREVFQRPDSILNSSFRFQLLATLSVYIMILSHGASIGWLSPTLSKILSPDSPLDFPITIPEASWIGSLVGLGSLTGNIIFGVLMDIAGRKFCIYLLALPHIGLWILIYVAQNVEYLYIGRFLSGMSGGGSYCVFSIFVSEIADSRIRGALSSILIVSLNAGILLGYILGTYLSYFIIPIVVVMLPILYLVLAIFFPETPHYLMRKGNYLAAEKSLKFYRNCSGSINYNEMQKCNQEFEELKAAFTKQKDDVNLSYKDFITKPALKAFCTATVLLFVHQFCGTFAFINYMSSIFVAAGSALDPNTSTIIVGVVQIAGSYAATLLVDRFGRKILLLISTVGMSLATVLFGVYTYFSQFYDLTAYDWVPLVLMMFFIFITNLGIVAVTFVIFVELFPAKIRSLAVSYCMAGLSLMVFLILKVFPIYLQTFGVSITMWSCAAVSFGGFVYFLIFLPETKGRSMTESYD